MTAEPAQIAIDLGAESCRVSLLQWRGGQPEIRMVRRFANGPWPTGAGLCWNLQHICDEIEAGLRSCAELAPEGIATLGVTGWAVDYVRLNAAGQPLAPPFCYRDPRATAAAEAVHARVPAAELYAITGVQVQPLNTIYQLFADKSAVLPASSWVNLPEYILHWLGAPVVAEYTNATHTALIDAATRQWSETLFGTLGLDRAAAPELVPAGTVLGLMRGPLAHLPAFQETRLIAPACHDTASAIAGIPEMPGAWAYISSGTWSLVGALEPRPHRSAEACARGFTNLGAAGEHVLFHRGITGMWLLRQSMETWKLQHPPGHTLPGLLEEASRVAAPEALLDLDDPAFLGPGDMPARIDAQLRSRGLEAIPDGRERAARCTRLILQSLAERYAGLLEDLGTLTGHSLDHICVVGGGSRNTYLNELTQEACGLPVVCCSAESSTIGNLALQRARLEQESGALLPEKIVGIARSLAGAALVG